MVASDYPDRTGTGDMFQYSVDAIASIGFSTTMSYSNSGFASDYAGQTWGSTPTTMTELMQTTPYVYLFTSSGIDRHVIQVWTFTNGPGSDPPAINVTSGQYLAEYTEIYDAAVHLLSTYSNKEFVFKNWEGDWQLLSGFVPETNIPSYRAERYAAFARVRQRAVRDARATVNSSSTINYCIEVNRCLDDHGYRLHRDVIPYVKPDMVGWSAYEAILSYTEGWERDSQSAAFATATNDIKGLAYGNGVYVCVGTGGEISRSLDAETWQSVTSSFSSSDVLAVRWLTQSSQFVAVGAGGKIATSPDGETWTQRTSGVAVQLNGILESGAGVIFVYGNAATVIYSSNSGTTWQSVTFSGGAPSGSPDFTCGDLDDVESGNFVIAGTNGKAVYGGTTCTSATTGFGSDSIRGVSARKTAAGTFVLVGDSGTVTLSDYGGAAPYTSPAAGFAGSTVMAITRGQSQFVAVGAGGKIATSSDGATWTQRTSGTGATLVSVTYSASEDVFAYGCNGATGYSSDGISWYVNGQTALTGVDPYHLLSVDGMTLTGGDNNLITTAKWWHANSAACDNIDIKVRKGYLRLRAAAGPGVPIIISEAGWPQDESFFPGLGLSIESMIQQLIDTSTDLGIEGLIWWQVFDNEEQSPGVPRGFSCYDRNGSSTTHGGLNGAGNYFASILP